MESADALGQGQGGNLHVAAGSPLHASSNFRTERCTGWSTRQCQSVWMDPSDLLWHAELAFMGLFPAVGKALSPGSKADPCMLGVLIWLEMAPRCLCAAVFDHHCSQALGEGGWGEEDGADAAEPE